MAFRTFYGHYEFLGMFVCLKNAQEGVMDLMNKVFWNNLDSFVSLFIEDIFVYSKNDIQHMDHLKVVLQVR